MSGLDLERVAYERFVELSLVMHDEGQGVAAERMRRLTGDAAREVLMGALLWAQGACDQHGDLRREMLRTNAERLERRRRAGLRLVPDEELESPW